MASIARTVCPLGRRVVSAATTRSPLVVVRDSCLWQRRSAVLRRFSTIGSLGFGVVAGEKRYTKEHEWIELSEDGTIGTIGISTHAAHSLGDIVYVELPALATTVGAGDMLGAVESVKSASDILTPVSGTVVERNEVLEEKPGLLNQAPEADGWIVKLRVRDAREVEGLMGIEEYGKFTGE
ncbi:MAG: glycine cleavage system H-protein subunit [Geoglossum simile]|nr:MAG: glycine cleavage system H-protein subunit [Geoglossum simile]